MTGTRLTGAQHPQQLDAVEVGQPEVEHDQVRRVVEHPLQAEHAGRLGRDRVPAVGQRPGQGGPDPGVVLDEEQHGHPPTVVRQLPGATAGRHAARGSDDSALGAP